jgi:Tfp pilus assembly protein PilP
MTAGGAEMGKNKRFALINTGVMCFLVFFNAEVNFANSEDGPLVIRKKIEVPEHMTSRSDINREADTKPERHAFSPGSDLAEIKETDETDEETEEILTATYSSKKQQTSRYNPNGKIDLGQLRLTGIIMASDKNLGLVQEASGKGHIIARGTHIGTRGGRVWDILKDRVIIKETMISSDGRTVVQEKELKLRNKSS